MSDLEAGRAKGGCGYGQIREGRVCVKTRKCGRMRSCLLVLDFAVSDKFIVSICESLKVCELRAV